MSEIRFIVPGGIDDPALPSGGNTYDRRIRDGLAEMGWSVRMLALPGAWPDPGAEDSAALRAALEGLDDGATVLLDGLIASATPEALAPHAGRLRLVALVHMPLGNAREGAALAATTAIVTTSEWSRDVLRRLHGLDHVRVAHPGVDPAGLASGTVTSGTLLCVAAVIPGKGHDVLVDALDTVPGEWECVCVGSLERDPAFAEHLRRRLADRGLEGRVRFTGARSREEVARDYLAADVLVHASRAETYGMVVTEALAAGLPVVASDVGGVPEALGHGTGGERPGLLVPPGDPAALAGALRAWLADGGLRRRLRRAARERRGALPRWADTTAVVAGVLAEAAR